METAKDRTDAFANLFTTAGTGAISVLQGDNPCPNDHLDCSNITVNLTPTLATAGGAGCSYSADFGLCSIEQGQENIAFTPVPEPSTWAMMALGFAGLGLAGYRSSRKRLSTPAAA